MSETQDREQERAAEDEEVKIIDLEPDVPLGESKSVRLTSALLRWQRSPQRRSWRLLGTVSFLLLLVVLLSVSHLSPSAIIQSYRSAYAPPARPSPSGSSLPVPPGRDGITCLRDAIWSPDNQFIAVLGYSQTCSDVAYVPGLVNLYEAQTGKLLRQLHPDDAIVQALKAAVASPGEPVARAAQQKQGARRWLVISYRHVIWSPDTQRLACTFRVEAPSLSLVGVVLMNREGAHAQVLLAQQNPLAPSSTEWDLERSQLSTANAFPFPPALAYKWGPRGTVRPSRVLPPGALPAAPPLGVRGNPDGDPSFTLWQPAVTQVTVVYYSYSFTFHGWITSFAAWSPDGRYLIDDLSFWGLLDAPEVISADARFGKDTDVPRASNDPGAVGVTNHCAALLKAVNTPLAFAWSPNGRVLADYGAGNGVDLYACPTGHRLTSFSLQSQYAAPSADAVALRWSPDGSHLLLASTTFGLATLWKVKQV
jgi:WD40 repeat protein